MSIMRLNLNTDEIDLILKATEEKLQDVASGCDERLIADINYIYVRIVERKHLATNQFYVRFRGAELQYIVDGLELLWVAKEDNKKALIKRLEPFILF